ncbi:histidine phosphatase family protein [Pleomorphomonas koreensis]|uniref:histidine phosphatase family protein n=1 Tax=Pleomorphomonas koreensis TaxID=257440 RepID=UPI00040B0760|nr:histidine phosphatase family protein [Pleomorphomonas koreensis]
MAIRLTLIAVPPTGRAPAFPTRAPFVLRPQDLPERVATRLTEADRLLCAPEIRLDGGLAAEAVADLTETDYGCWAGRTLAGIAADPAGLEAWRSDAAAAPHGGESLADVRRRIEGWLGRSLAASGRAVVLAPVTVVRTAVLAVLDAPTGALWSLDMTPWAEVALTGDGRRWALRL